MITVDDLAKKVSTTQLDRDLAKKAAPTLDEAGHERLAVMIAAARSSLKIFHIEYNRSPKQKITVLTKIERAARVLESALQDAEGDKTLWTSMRAEIDGIDVLSQNLKALKGYCSSARPKMERSLDFGISNGTTYGIDGMLIFLCLGWQQEGLHPSIWMDHCNNEFKGDWWLFVKSVIESVPKTWKIDRHLEEKAIYARARRIVDDVQRDKKQRSLQTISD